MAVIRNLAFEPATPEQVDQIGVLLPQYAVSPEHRARLAKTIREGRLSKDVAAATVAWIKRQRRLPAEVIIPTPQETIDRMEAEMRTAMRDGI